jgi:ribosomal protein S12 methylthiotransferase accessory factor
VYQAIRPNSRSLSVSQGKGFTAAAAKVSAVMESAELWHAERVPRASREARVRDLEAGLGYDVFDLRHLEHSLLNRGTRLDWLEGELMDGSGRTFVPWAFVSLDGRMARRWAPPLFFASSNGLASGNSLDEAALHALLELVERDSTARARALPSESQRAVDLLTVGAPEPREILDRIAAAGMDVRVFDESGPTGLPSFQAELWSEDHPLRFGGYGCHLDASVALCRALTEAAQSRLAQIVGSRDDLTTSFRRGLGAAPRRGIPPLTARSVSFRDVRSLATDDVGQDLAIVVDKVRSHTGVAPIVVDLSREDLDIPVVKVLAPGLLFDH